MTSPPRDPPAPRAGPGAELVRLLGGPGDVALRVWPVADHARLSRAIALLTRMDGVEGAAVERFDSRGAVLVVHVVGTVSVDAELEARLDRGIVDCRLVDGRIDLQLVPRSTGAPRPGAPLTLVDGSVIPPELRGHVPSSAASKPPAPGDPDPPAAGGSPGPRAAEARRRWAPRPPAEPPPRVAPGDDLIESALRSILGLSMLVCDTSLRVRTIAGPAFGRPRDRAQASGRPVRDVLPQEAWRALAPGLAAALSGVAESVEIDGAEPGSRYLATCSPIVDDGVVIGATVGARDLAAECGEQAELAALRDEFDEVFAHSPIGQALLSVSGRGVRVSDALCALLGRAEADLIGEDAADWVHPDDRRSSAVRFRRLLAGREDVEPTSFRVLAAEGRTVHVRAHVSVLRSPAGWPRGVVFQIEHVER